MSRKSELVAIHGGRDWYDASASYYRIPLTVDIEEVQKAWNEWCQRKYMGLYFSPNCPEYMNLEEFLVKYYGAVEATDKDIQIVGAH